MTTIASPSVGWTSRIPWRAIAARGVKAGQTVGATVEMHAVRQHVVLGRADHKVHTLLPVGELFINIAFPVGDHRHAGGAAFDQNRGCACLGACPEDCLTRLTRGSAGRFRMVRARRRFRDTDDHGAMAACQPLHFVHRGRMRRAISLGRSMTKRQRQQAAGPEQAEQFGEHQDLWGPCLASLGGPGELSFAHPDSPQILTLS